MNHLCPSYPCPTCQPWLYYQPNYQPSYYWNNPVAAINPLTFSYQVIEEEIPDNNSNQTAPGRIIYSK